MCLEQRQLHFASAILHQASLPSFCFCITSVDTSCFFVLTAHFLILQSPEGGPLALADGTGLCGQQWNSLSRRATALQGWLCGAAHQLGLAARATGTNLPLHFFLTSVTLFIWIDFRMAGSQSRFKHFALWDHPSLSPLRF